MNYTVRTAHTEDLELLVHFAHAEAVDAEGINLPPEIVRKGILTALENPAVARYWVLADVDGQVVGHISVVREWSNWKAGYYWWIQSLYIRPEHRGKNGLELLLEKIKETARQENALEVRLGVHRDNLRARRAYQRNEISELPYILMRMDL